MTLAHYWSVMTLAYYWSQVALALIAFAAAIVAYEQVRTFKRFELLKMLEDPRIRKARRMLYQRLRVAKEPALQIWWEDDDDLEEAASTVCASFDIVGRMARGRNRRFIIRGWSYNICWTYEILDGYLCERQRNNPLAYDGYRKLYGDAKRFDPRPQHSN